MLPQGMPRTTNLFPSSSVLKLAPRFGYQVAIYRAEEDAPKKQASALVALATGSAPKLVKIPLQDIEFHVLSAQNADAMCQIGELQQLPACEPSISARTLPVNEVSSDCMLAACGGRGICTVATPDGRLFVFDLEEDEEGEEEENDEGADEDGDEEEADEQEEDEEKD